MTQAIIYCRFSPRPNPEECGSIRLQFQRCRVYCQANGYQIVGVRWDSRKSAGRANNRPGLQRAIAQACKAKALLVVYKLDRLARNTRDALEIADKLHEAKADLALTSQHINTRSPMGKAFYSIMAVFAELERAQIVERTQDAMRGHQKNGRRMGRVDRCPYGTMPDWNGPMLDKVNMETGQLSSLPARLIESPEELAIIERIKQLRTMGNGAKKIASLLDAEGIKCRGNRWNDFTVRSVLKRA
jgi:site-specific DNA recombinase